MTRPDETEASFDHESDPHQFNDPSEPSEHGYHHEQNADQPEFEEAPPQNAPAAQQQYASPSPQYPPQNAPAAQQQYPSPSPQYPPQNPRAYPPQQPAYPPQKPAYPPQQPRTYPPQQPAYPQAVRFPPANPAAGAPSQYPPPQYPPPPLSPHKPYNQGAASGFPVQQYPPAGGGGQLYGNSVVGTEGWSSGLFDCMNDPSNAIITACFPCLTFGQIAEIVDSGHTTCSSSGLIYAAIACCIAMPCLISCTYRTKLRNQYGLMETPAPDWLTHCLCEWCALCQEYRELKARGFDPELGWHGNMAKQQMQQGNIAMTPPTNQTMMG